MTRGSVAKKIREYKEAHPERYCPTPKCLWRMSSGPCRKHANQFQINRAKERAAELWNGQAWNTLTPQQQADAWVNSI